MKKSTEALIYTRVWRIIFTGGPQAAQRSVRFLADGPSHSSNALYKKTGGRKMAERTLCWLCPACQSQLRHGHTQPWCAVGVQSRLLNPRHNLCSRLLHKSNVTSQRWLLACEAHRDVCWLDVSRSPYHHQWPGFSWGFPWAA